MQAWFCVGFQPQAVVALHGAPHSNLSEAGAGQGGVSTWGGEGVEEEEEEEDLRTRPALGRAV